MPFGATTFGREADVQTRSCEFDPARFAGDARAVNRPCPFDLVIFDCDGVLVDSEGIAETLLADMSVELGVRFDGPDEFRCLRGERFAKCLKWLEAEIGRPLPPDFEEVFRVRSRKRFERELKPISGVGELLQGLRNPFCVASNGPRDKIELNLGITGLLPMFEGRMFSAYELGVWKPDPRFYREVAASLGFEAARCAVVEDSAPGVSAALGAGMTVFQFLDGDEALPGARAGAHVFHEMSALADLLAGLRREGS